jgi:hypothetical protein
MANEINGAFNGINYLLFFTETLAGCLMCIYFVASAQCAMVVDGFA